MDAVLSRMLPIPALTVSAACAHAATDRPVASPQALGLDATRVSTLQASLAARNAKTLSAKKGTASPAKAAVGGRSLPIATNEGRISDADLASKYIPAWKDDPRKSRLTIRRLATHTASPKGAEATVAAARALRSPVTAGASTRCTTRHLDGILRQSPATTKGGWGSYDAPEPWGMWAVAYHTADWGLGGKHGYRLPSKWISRDGRTMYLLFSGAKHREVSGDAFYLRRMTLKVK